MKHFTVVMAALLMCVACVTNPTPNSENGMDNYLKFLNERSAGNHKIATKYLRMAAEEGKVIAQYFLGEAYFEGKHVPQNYPEACKWYKKAAEQGDRRSQLRLGNCYFEGHNGPENFPESAKWFRKAAEQGESSALNNLGFAYSHGLGVPQDYVLAYMLLILAANVSGDTNTASTKTINSNLYQLQDKISPIEISRAKALAAQWKRGTPLPTKI